MKKWILSLAVVSLIICENNCRTEGSHIDQEEKSIEIETVKILSQSKTKREFSQSTLREIANIPLRETDNPIYRPTYIKYDKYGAIYIMDFYDNSIHKFIPIKNETRFEHKIFRNDINQKTDGLSRVLDFKIFNDALYLVNEGSASIDVYSFEGVRIKRIKIADTIPLKVTISDKNIIVKGKYLPKRLFKMCDMEGNILYEYGDYIDRSNIDNSIYHDDALSETFGDGFYYSLPYYLGFISLYQKGQLRFAKETIDGLSKKAEAVKKTVIENQKVMTVNKKFETATMYAVQKNYLLIKASDIENKKSYWDLYDLFSNDYLLTIKDNPRCRFIDIWNDYLACVDDTNLRIFSMKDVLKEAEDYKRKIK